MAQGWPSVQYQELSWPPPGHSLEESWSNRRRRAHRGKYQQAVVPAIADAEVQLSPVLASDVQNITDDLTRFDAQYQGVPHSGLYCFAASHPQAPRLNNSPLTRGESSSLAWGTNPARTQRSLLAIPRP